MPRRGALLFPLLILLIGASLIREASVGGLVAVEEAWCAILQKHLAAPNTPAPVTVVEIGDDALQRHVPPWSSEDFAVFFHAVLPFDPAVLGVEPALDPQRGIMAGGDRDPLFERMLGDGVRRAPKLVLGGRLSWSPDHDAAPTLQAMPILHKVRGDLSKVPAFTAVSEWAAEDYRFASQPGWLNLPDPQNPARYPLLFLYQGQPVPSMPLQLAMLWEKVTPEEVEIELGSHIQCGKVRIPIDATGRMPMHAGVKFERVNYDDLLLIREQVDQGAAPQRPTDLFRQRLVLLARTDTPSRTIPTATGALIAPGEFVAGALATIQLRAWSGRVTPWFDWALVGLVAIPCFWLRGWKATRAAIIVILLEAAYIGAAFVVQKNWALALPGVLPLGLALSLLVLRALAKKFQRVIAF